MEGVIQLCSECTQSGEMEGVIQLCSECTQSGEMEGVIQLCSECTQSGEMEGVIQLCSECTQSGEMEGVIQLCSECTQSGEMEGVIQLCSECTQSGEMEGVIQLCSECTQSGEMEGVIQLCSECTQSGEMEGVIQLCSECTQSGEMEGVIQLCSECTQSGEMEGVIQLCSECTQSGEMEGVKTRAHGLPSIEPNSEEPVFGSTVGTYDKLLEQRRRAHELYRYQLEVSAKKRKDALLNRIVEQKKEQDMLERNRKELIVDRVAHYDKLRSWRASLEETWAKTAEAKRQRGLEEEQFRKSGSHLLLEQCQKYGRCYRCKRRTTNCGESNIWMESRYIPGSRLMI
ncbi:UNVERIFIED_CONTAM: hypothetical protein FKN15_051050 [Acipenser sinensis]